MDVVAVSRQAAECKHTRAVRTLVNTKLNSIGVVSPVTAGKLSLQQFKTWRTVLVLSVVVAHINLSNACDRKVVLDWKRAAIKSLPEVMLVPGMLRRHLLHSLLYCTTLMSSEFAAASEALELKSTFVGCEHNPSERTLRRANRPLRNLRQALHSESRQTHSVRAE